MGDLIYKFERLSRKKNWEMQGKRCLIRIEGKCMIELEGWKRTDKTLCAIEMRNREGVIRSDRRWRGYG